MTPQPTGLRFHSRRGDEGEFAMAPVTEVCTPRDDVLAGGLREEDFAVKLELVVRNHPGYQAYADADAFFAATHPTQGLCKILRELFGSLSRGEGQSIIRVKDAFGGGKTHALIAAWHLARGARPAGLDKFIESDLLPDGACPIAAIVGEALDPISGTGATDKPARTIWGEIAAQLGEQAWAVMADNDAQRTVPGTGTIADMVGDEPTVVVIDELAHHVRQCATSGNAEVRAYAQSIPAFLKGLLETAAASKNLAVVLSLASHQDAYRQETSDLEEALRQLETDTGAEAESIIARQAREIVPAADDELAEIAKTRLFTRIDEHAAEETAEAYRSLYATLVEQGVLADFDINGYSRQIAASYPFHSVLFEVLDKRVATNPQFQRTRGALRLLGHAVAVLWQAHRTHQPPIINAGDLPLEQDAVRLDLTDHIDRDKFRQVAEVDFAGPDSHAARIDAANFSDGHYATRAATCVFLHSLEQGAGKYVGFPEVLVGVLTPGEDPAPVDRALKLLDAQAWHFASEPSGWRFQTEANPNRIIDTEARNVAPGNVLDEREKILQRLLKSTATCHTHVFPESLDGVADKPRFDLVAVSADDLTTVGKQAATPPNLLQQARSRYGGQPRTYRNGIGYLVADDDALGDAERAIRRRLGADRATNDSDLWASLTDAARDKLQTRADQARATAAIAVARTWRHLYFPRRNTDQADLAHRELSTDVQGNIGDRDGGWTTVVWEALKEEGKVHDGSPYSHDWIDKRLWPHQAEEVATADLLDRFWQDPNLPLLVDRSALAKGIRTGVTADRWVYVDQRDADHPQVVTSSDHPPEPVFDASVLLVRRDVAEQRGLLARPATVADVTTAVPAGENGIGFADLRDRVETAIDGQLSTTELEELVAQAVEREQLAVRRSDGELARPAEVRHHKLARNELRVIPADVVPAEVEIPTGERAKVQRTEGSAGQAVSQLKAKAADHPSDGFTNLSVSVSEGADGDWAIVLAALDLAAAVPGVTATLNVHIVAEPTARREGEITAATNGEAPADQTMKWLRPVIDATRNRATLARAAVTATFTFDQPCLADSHPASSVFDAVTHFVQGQAVKLTGRLA
jgi:hypothetical protein